LISVNADGRELPNDINDLLMQIALAASRFATSRTGA
jgi:hypothetical protein